MREGGGRRPENGQHPDLVPLDILGQCMHAKSLQLCPTLCAVRLGAWASQVVLMVKSLSVNAGDTGDMGSVPGSGRSPGEGNGTHSSILAWGIP